MSPPEAPAALVRWLFEYAWSQGETDRLDELIGELTFHYGGSAIVTDGGRLRGLIGQYREGFPDLRFEVADLIEQGELIAVRSRLRGTHLGTWRDLAATGREIDYDVAMFFRFEAGRLVEVWEVDDAARRDRQLGVG